MMDWIRTATNRILLLVSLMAPLLALPEATAAQGLSVAAANAATDYAAAIGRAREIIVRLVAEENIPGFSIAVGLGGEVLWSEGFGMANLEHRVPVTTLTKFRIGSVSKPVTAMAMGILMQEGLLDLDEPVQTYVPSFPEKRYRVTVRQVSGHIAGIRHYRGNENLSAQRYETVEESLGIFADDPLLFEPGTEYSYSSYGWNLLSAVVEGAAGVPFLDFMRDRVFEPLEMRHSMAGHTDSIIPHRTAFYVRSPNDGRLVNAPFVDNSYKWSSGGFLSTPEDLIRFGSAHLESGILHEATLEVFFTSQKLNDGEETGYGIGWRTGMNERGERVVGHTGGSVGGTTVLLVNRDRGLVVAAVANISGARMGPQLATRIGELFLGRVGGQ